MAYIGPQILVADCVLWPSRSIIKQSYEARERRNDSSLPFHLGYGNLNADGFGIGWYAEGQKSGQDETPCVFTSVTPAWNNDNLSRLATKLESGLIFAHVRAAYPGMPVSEQNCHPFQWGRYLFMHNGVVGGFMAIRRKLLGTLSDTVYNTVQSFHSDSAVSFAVFLNCLPDLHSKHSPQVLLRAVEQAIAAISRVQREEGIDDVSLLNYVVSDGDTLIATRFTSDEDESGASLYYAEGNSFERSRPSLASAAMSKKAINLNTEEGLEGVAGARSKSVTGESDYHLTFSEMGSRVVLVASEPVTSSASDWVEVPHNTALVVAREKGSILALLQSPLCLSGCHPRQEEVSHCLEAAVSVAGLAQLESQLTKLRPLPSGDHLLREASDVSGATAAPEGSEDTRTQPTPPGLFDSGGKAPGGGRHHGPLIVTGEEHSLTHSRHCTVMTLCATEGLLFSGSSDCSVKVWSLNDACCIKVLHGHRDPIRAIQVVGRWLCTAGAKTVRLWSLATWQVKAVVQIADISGSAKALAVAPDGSLFVGGQDCRVKRFRLISDSSVVGRAPAPESGVVGRSPAPESGCCMQGDSPRFMSQDDTVRSCVGKAVDPVCCSEACSSHCSAVTALALCGKYLWSASGDSTIRVWDPLTLKPLKVLRAHRGSVLALHAAPGLVLSGGRDCLIRVWDAEALVCRRTLSGHTMDVLSLAGLDVPTMVGAPSFDIADVLGTFQAIASPSAAAAPPDPASGAASTDRALLFASSSADGTVRVWSARTYSCLRIFRMRSPVRAQEPLPVMACAITPSAVAAATADDGSIRLFNADDMFLTAVNELYGLASSNGSGEVHTAASSPAARRPLDAQLNKEFERALRSFIKLKTVSADPALHEDCFRGAKFLMRLLEAMGAETKLTQARDDKNPVVLGRIGHDPARPTVCFYGHYDVQPALEPEWETDPFELVARDGYYVARGVTDNKGPILAFIYAVRELLEECKDGDSCLPVNVAFLLEGEEENGSVGFYETVQQNLRWFEGVSLVVISNTLWVGENVPCLTCGCRGMISASVEVRGPERDLHSGNEGGVFVEPLACLTKVLGTLVDSHSQVMVPGFSLGVRENMLEAGWPRLAESREFSLEQYKQQLGVPSLIAARSERDLLHARWCQPTLSVVDVRVGGGSEEEEAAAAGRRHYRFGPTRFSVIPKAAVGKISVRYVPNQSAEQLVDALSAHVGHEFAKLRSGNSVAVKVHSVGHWWEADPSAPEMRMAEKAIEEEWGVPPLLVREGGTMPVASALEKLLGAPAVLLPMGQSSDAPHLANERVRVQNLVKGRGICKRLLRGMAQLTQEQKK